MVWHATDSVNPAVNKTMDLLFRPFRLGFWLKLAFVALFVGFGGRGSVSGGPRFSVDRSVDLGSMMDPSSFFGTVTGDFLIIAVIACLILLLVLVFGFIRSIMRFVFLESVLRSRVEILSGFRRHMDNGLRVFVFELGVVLAFLLFLAAPLFISYFALGITDLLPLVIVFFLVLLFLGLPFFIVMSFTESFVVPYVYKGKGVVEGWKRLLSVISEDILQTAAYIFVKIVLLVASAILALFLVIFALLILLIPALIVGLIVLLIGWAIVDSGIGGVLLGVFVAVAVLLAIVAVFVLVYVITFVTLPIPVFFRFYSLVFLTKIDKSFKIPELGNMRGKAPASR